MKENKFPIKLWAQDDKPREKLILKGREALSDAELLAIIIGIGNDKESAVDLSKRILNYYNNNLSELSKKSTKDLMQFKGIGEAKSVSIVACLELGRRRRMQEALVVPAIDSSKNAFELMQPHIGDLNHEEFWVIYLNNSNKVLYKNKLSKGGITATMVDMRILFKTAFENQATAIIVSHNHPSGKLEPSEEDISLTRKIMEASKLLEIKLLDHLIITADDYFSFADNGML